MPDESTCVQELKDNVRGFCAERGWLPFHTPKNLGLALASEVGELLDHFRYRSDEEIAAYLATPSGRNQIADEVADCFWVLLRIAEVAGIDVSHALSAKLTSSARKYPVDQVFGKPDKYTTYANPDASAPG